MRHLDEKSNLLKVTLPQARRLRDLEEENQRLKEAARGIYPDQTTFYSFTSFYVLTVMLFLVQAESLAKSAVEAERLHAECLLLRDSESLARATCESLKDSESAAWAELQGMSPTGAPFSSFLPLDDLDTLCRLPKENSSSVCGPSGGESGHLSFSWGVSGCRRVGSEGCLLRRLLDGKP